MAQNCKKDTLAEKVQKTFNELHTKTISSQNSGSIIVESIEQVRGTNDELDSLNIVDCFVDGYGNYNDNLITLELM